MQIAGVAKEFSDTNLTLLAQLGVEHIVYYNMHGMPLTLEELAAVQQRLARWGLKLAVIEGGPPIDKIVLGKEGREQQIDQYIACLRHMGRLGVRVLCYNFMPQITSAAMVVRTNSQYAERGGALTSQYRSADFRPEMAPHNERPTTDDEVWDHLDYFLRRIVPVAEQEEVLLAMHPDDPPLSPLCGLARILRSPESFARLCSLVDSPVNGLTFCQGCFAEMGTDLAAAIRRFRERIHFVHFRDIRGTPDDFYETFPDTGQHDMLELIRTYREIDFRGFIRIDHAPLLVTESGPYDGYGMYGHTFAIGYLKGLMEAVYGRPR